MLPFLKLPGPVEVDESKIGAQRWSHLGRFPKKLRWVVGLICRTTRLPIVYYLPNKRHDTLAELFKPHLEAGTIVLSDCHPSYVKLRSAESKLAPYGWYHFWINHSERFVHEKFSFVHTNNIERNWRSLKSTISYVKYSVREERIHEYLQSYMLRCLCRKDKRYFMLLSVIHAYYQHHMATYLQRQSSARPLHYLPTLCSIDASYYSDNGEPIYSKDFHGPEPPKSLDPLFMDERERFRFGFFPGTDVYDRELIGRVRHGEVNHVDHLVEKQGEYAEKRWHKYDVVGGDLSYMMGRTGEDEGGVSGWKEGWQRYYRELVGIEEEERKEKDRRKNMK